MPIRKLAHYWIRSHDLKKSCHFYEKVLGFTAGCQPTPDMLGVWMYLGGFEADIPTVYIVEICPSNPQIPTSGFQTKAPVTKFLSDAGSSDRLTLWVTGLVDCWNVLHAEGVAWRDHTAPELGLHQVFIEDPSGVVIELNFPTSEIAALGFEVFPYQHGYEGMFHGSRRALISELSEMH